MDIVIPFRSDLSPWQNNELRYALRSFEKHLKGIKHVWLIGNGPEWISERVKIMHHPDRWQHNKDANIFEKMLAVAKNTEISDPFLFANDDHFLLKNTRAREIPNYYHNTLIEKVNASKKVIPDYPAKCLRTGIELTKLGKPILNYDIHVPMLMYKSQVIESLSSVDYKTEGVGLVMKSVYGNFFPFPSKPLEDCKIDKPESWQRIQERTAGRFCFSVGDRGLNLQMREYLNQLFPTKSSFEL
jgi:hypothetical protein